MTTLYVMDDSKIVLFDYGCMLHGYHVVVAFT